jgi:hypothetical protein
MTAEINGNNSKGKFAAQYLKTGNTGPEDKTA